MNLSLGDPAYWHRVPSAFTIIDPFLIRRGDTDKTNFSKHNQELF